jgi:broad specificity phosphatase PhoE
MVKPLNAPVVVHLLRHGEKMKVEGEKEEVLTEKGHQQAFKAGRELRELIPKNAIVKMYASPFKRVQQTREEIAMGLGRPSRAPRTRESLAIGKATNPEREKELFKELGQQEFVTRIVKGTLEPGVTESSEQTASRLRRQTLELAGRIVGKRKSILARVFSKPIHLVFATHQGGLDKLVMKLTGKELEELGGLSGYLERLSVEVPYKGPLRLHYRGKVYEAPREWAERH